MEAAAAGSIASTGFKAATSIVSGYGNKAKADADAAKAEFDAARAERAAEMGRIAADQTDAQYREELNVTLSNIDAVRASSGLAPGSPTGEALKDHEAFISDRQRRSKVASIRAQANEDAMSATWDRSVAAYDRSVGKQAVLLGYLGAGAAVGGGIAQGYGVTRGA